MAEELNIVGKFIPGCLNEKVDLRDYKVCAANVFQEFPKEFKLSNLPQIKNQLEVGSCVAHATSSILEYFDNNKQTLSTNFIYGIQHKYLNRDHKGMYLIDACKIVKEFGDMTENDCPGNYEIPVCYSKAEQSLNDNVKKSRAYYYRIESYYKCSTDNDIKYALMHYGPVLASINTFSQGKITKDDVWQFDETSEPSGGHAIVIYGWDSRGWLCQNSWGKFFAGDGRMVIKFGKIKEARALVDHDNSEDGAMIKPNNNCILDVAYKTANFFINSFISIFKK